MAQRPVLVLTGRERRDEVLRFVRKHHYSRACPGVWSLAYVLENARGRLQAVALISEPPYPSVKATFVRDPALQPRVALQARMVAAGVTANELDALIQFANRDLAERGYWWLYTLSEPTAQVVDGALRRILCPGFTGEVYARNHFDYLGHTGRAPLRAWRIDGRLLHPRQGPVTLTRGNVHEHFPDARVLLMRFKPQPWEPAVQPRLLARLMRGVGQKRVCAGQEIDGRRTGAISGTG
jgi:hypothetical protein